MSFSSVPKGSEQKLHWDEAMKRQVLGSARTWAVGQETLHCTRGHFKENIRNFSISRDPQDASGYFGELSYLHWDIEGSNLYPGKLA